MCVQSSYEGYYRTQTHSYGYSTVSSRTNNTTAQNRLSERVIPDIILRKGYGLSLTATPIFEHGTNAADCALGKFRVNSNATVKGGADTLDLAAYTALLDHELLSLAIFDANLPRTKASSCR